MIFDETYRAVFERRKCDPLFSTETGPVLLNLHAVATRTGVRVARYISQMYGQLPLFANLAGPAAVMNLLQSDVDVVCVATPDDRHYHAARDCLRATKHVLIEKPSVLTLSELDDLTQLATRHEVLAKVVYHKLADPDHKKLRMTFETADPPTELYHGTAHRNLAAIRREGLRKMARHHVHLSADADIAKKVGARHGTPVVLTVDAGRMHADGHVFYRSANGVWLVVRVPPEYLRE